MEIGKEIEKALLPKRSPRSLQSTSRQITRQSDGTITAYTSEDPIDGQSATKESIKLLMAFPQIEKQFADLLITRAKELNWTKQRLTDAINNLIDTCPYPQPTLANVLSFDKRIKTYTYEQMCNMAYEYGSSVWENYKRLDDDVARGRYAHVGDIQQYNLKTKKSQS